MVEGKKEALINGQLDELPKLAKKNFKKWSSIVFVSSSSPERRVSSIYELGRNKKPEKSLLIIVVAYLFSGYRARKLKPEANLIAFCMYRRNNIWKGCVKYQFFISNLYPTPRKLLKKIGLLGFGSKYFLKFNM